MSTWSPSEARLPLFVHIALGVFLGSLAAAAVVWRVAQWQAERAVAEVAESLARQQAAAVRALREDRDATERRAATQRASAASAQQAQEQMRLRRAEEAARREAAWAAFYRKPAACDEARGGSWTVDCANGFIRAQKQFAALYDAGKL